LEASRSIEEVWVIDVFDLLIVGDWNRQHREVFIIDFLNEGRSRAIDPNGWSTGCL